jgi:transcriptional regulator with XRE-family HTH domain
LSKQTCQSLIFKLILHYNFSTMLNKIDFSDRLKDLRKRKGISQGELAELIEVHFTQVSRYERGETKPNAEAMTKLAKALDTTVDFLMNGTADDVVNDAGLEKELISRFKEVQDLETEDKRTVLSLMDAYIAKTKIQTLLQAK